ncbi:MAG: S8 family serine peptidase, partial [Betaproteobacteria bacterium]|nr:S8 family serine peptidase [Betaproteobacteria bacterium]
ITTGSTPVTVAVLDTGVLPHADLAGRILPGYDFVSDTTRANDGDGRDADASDPGDWVTSGEASTSGGPFEGCPVTNSRWHGTVIAGIIAAAGKSAQNTATYSPAICSNVITVAAVDQNGGLAPYSITGEAVALSAPGGIGIGVDGIPSTSDNGTQGPANDNAYLSGQDTSLAAAHVSGAASPRSCSRSSTSVRAPAGARWMAVMEFRSVGLFHNTDCHYKSAAAMLFPALKDAPARARRYAGRPRRVCQAGQCAHARHEQVIQPIQRQAHIEPEQSHIIIDSQEPTSPPAARHGSRARCAPGLPASRRASRHSRPAHRRPH